MDVCRRDQWEGGRGREGGDTTDWMRLGLMYQQVAIANDVSMWNDSERLVVNQHPPPSHYSSSILSLLIFISLPIIHTFNSSVFFRHSKNVSCPPLAGMAHSACGSPRPLAPRHCRVCCTASLGPRVFCLHQRLLFQFYLLSTCFFLLISS